MKPEYQTWLTRGLLFAALAVPVSLLPATAADETENQAGHESTPGGHEHAADPEAIAFIREIAPSMADRSDEEIVAMMKMMPPNYGRYVSDRGMQGSTGVLVITHGFGEVGDEIFATSLTPVAQDYPTAVGFGMAMMTSEHIQASVDELVAAGAQTIVAVPATQSRHDTGIRQYQYIMGQRSEPAYMAVPQVATNAKVLFTPPLADHPLVSEILLEHANEIGSDPAGEAVIIVGHGPADDADNARELEMMQSHADYIRAHSGYADAQVINLQDDALKATRAANVKTLRQLVEEANAEDHEVLVVGFLLGTAGIQPKIEADLAGLNYRFNPKGMSEHSNFAVWVEQVVTEATESGAPGS